MLDTILTPEAVENLRRGFLTPDSMNRVCASHEALRRHRDHIAYQNARMAQTTLAWTLTAALIVAIVVVYTFWYVR